MDHKYNPALRIISTVVLSFFLWTFGGVFEVAYAVKDIGQKSESRSQKGRDQHAAPNTQVAGEKRSEEKFSKAVEDVESILKDEKTDHETMKQRIKAKRAEIEGHDTEIRKQFSETEGKIKDLPDVIKKRHRDFVKHYDDNLRELKTNLEEIDKAKDKAEVEVKVEKAKRHLEKVKPPKRHKALDPNKLPHRTEEPVWKEPRTKPEEFEKDSTQQSAFSSQRSKPILLASNGSLEGLLSAKTQYNTKTTDLLPDGSFQIALVNPPTAADLAENGIEIVFTPAIRAKAAELGNKPVKIYEWVRNNIEYVPTYGSIQGADMCLQTKLCNDFDTASLLIAMLRVSGIHAKYVYGTIELPIEKVKNWAGGFTDTMAALSLFASAGVPTKGMIDAGVVKHARLEHTWVEAFIDYIPSRGSRHKTGEGDTWIPLDASFKQYTYTSGIDIKSAVPFDAQTFIDQIKNTATINEAQGYVTNVNSLLVQQTMQDYQSRVQGYISQNYPNATVGDVLGKKEIIKQEFPYLLGTLPYRPIVKGATYSTIPDSKRHRITFEVFKDAYDELLGTKLIITKSLPELAGKRISLNYVPATIADKNLLSGYVEAYATSVPAYLVNLKAELKVGDAFIATGPTVTMGTDQILNLTFISPARSETETHRMTAGDYNVIGLNLGGTKAVFEARVAQNDFSDPVSEMLYQTILGYWTEYDTLEKTYAQTYRVASVRLPSEGLSSAPVNIKYMFGVPMTGYYATKGLDVKRALNCAASLNGSKERVKGFHRISGMIGSLFEGLVYDQLFGYEIGKGLSAVRILEIANSQGIPIYHVNEGNIASILPVLEVSGDVINDIRNAVNSGKEVMVPKSNIAQEGWRGTGYIVLDPATGNGGYMIEGGTAGGVYMYEANMQAAMAIEETPYSPAIMAAVTSWEQSVGSAVLSEIAGELAIDIPALVPTVAGALMALTVLMLVVIIGAAIYQIVDAVKVQPKYMQFRHYTTLAAKTTILASPIKLILASDKGDLGPGAYVTDFFAEPDSGGPNSVAIGNAINKTEYDKIQTYVEMLIDVNRIILVNGALAKPEWKWQYVYPLRSLLIDRQRVILLGQ